MFLLKYLEVKEDEEEVLNIDFIGERDFVLNAMCICLNSLKARL